MDTTNLVPVIEVMQAVGASNMSQREFLRTRGVRSAHAIPSGKGYRHWITRANADLILAMHHAKPESKPRHRPAPKARPAHDVQLPIDFVHPDPQPSIWRRVRSFFTGARG